jgi:hypothetical protein
MRSQITSNQIIPSSQQFINSSQFINRSQISQRTTESLVTLLQFVMETAKILYLTILVLSDF